MSYVWGCLNYNCLCIFLRPWIISSSRISINCCCLLLTLSSLRILQLWIQHFKHTSPSQTCEYEGHSPSPWLTMRLTLWRATITGKAVTAMTALLLEILLEMVMVTMGLKLKTKLREQLSRFRLFVFWQWYTMHPFNLPYLCALTHWLTDWLADWFKNLCRLRRLRFSSRLQRLRMVLRLRRTTGARKILPPTAWVTSTCSRWPITMFQF